MSSVSVAAPHAVTGRESQLTQVDTGKLTTVGYVWNTTTLAYEVMTTSNTGVGTDVNVKNSSIAVTSSSLAQDATLTGGTTKAINRGGAKGATTAADLTGTAEGADHQALDVQVYHGGVAKDPTAIRALTNADVVKSQLQDNAGAAVTVGQKAMASSLPVAIASDQSAVGVTPPTLTKGTQGSTGFSTQDLKDAGRVTIMWTVEFSPTGTAEALLTVTESRDGAATTTFTSKVVTSGKRLRITSWTCTSENTLGANPKRNKVRMRFNTAGAATAASPLQANLVSSVGGTVNTVGSPALDDFPDGIEFLGDGTKQIGITNESPDWVTAAQTSKIYLTIFGYEY